MMDSTLANGATTGDLVLMQPQGSQPQHLFDLSHGQPRFRQDKPSTFQWRTSSRLIVQRQIARLNPSLIIPFRQPNHDSGEGEFLIRNQNGTAIRIVPESRFTSHRNADSHGPESAG